MAIGNVTTVPLRVEDEFALYRYLIELGVCSIERKLAIGKCAGEQIKWVT